MLKSPKRISMALFMVVLAVASACSSGSSEGGGADTPADGPSGTLTYGFSAALQSFDPLLASDINSRVYRTPVYEGLLQRRAPDFALEGGLATSWEVRDDNGDGVEETIRVELREGVTFTDGAAWNAEAVKVNLERPQPAGGATLPPRAGASTLVGVEVVDEMTADIVLDKVSYTYLTGLANGSMISPDAIADPDIDLATDPVGTGGWIYDKGESVAGVSYVYTANPDYWNPSQQGVERIEILTYSDPNARLNALLSGEINSAMLDGPTGFQAEEAGFEIVTTAASWNGLLILDRGGSQVEALGDVRVRQAMAYAMNREDYVDAVNFGFGTPSSQAASEGTEGYSAEVADRYDEDIEKAKELLAEAGYPDGFTFKMATAGSTDAAVAIAGFLEEIGITMEVQVIQASELTTKLTSGEFQAFGTNFPQSGPGDLVDLMLKPEGLLNPLKIDADPELLADLDTLNTTFDEGERATIAASMTEAIVEDAPVIVVSTSDQIAGVAEEVDNVYIPAGTPSIDFYGITISG